MIFESASNWLPSPAWTYVNATTDTTEVIYFRTPRERDEYRRLLAKWRAAGPAQARLDWLRARRLLGWARREERRPRPVERRPAPPWPVAVKAWRLQLPRLRKGSRISGGAT